MKNYVFVSAAVAGLLFAAPAKANDAAAGEKVFKKCKACHYVDRKKNKSGPHLVDIVGRSAGAVEGFKYSKAMAESGLVWDEATLAGFLAKPKKYLKGTKMSFAGLKKESDIANVIAYLKSAK
jgi:cytochrome c